MGLNSHCAPYTKHFSFSSRRCSGVVAHALDELQMLPSVAGFQQEAEIL